MQFTAEPNMQFVTQVTFKQCSMYFNVHTVVVQVALFSDDQS